MSEPNNSSSQSGVGHGQRRQGTSASATRSPLSSRLKRRTDDSVSTRSTTNAIQQQVSKPSRIDRQAAASVTPLRSQLLNKKAMPSASIFGGSRPTAKPQNPVSTREKDGDGDASSQSSSSTAHINIPSSSGKPSLQGEHPGSSSAGSSLRSETASIHRSIPSSLKSHSSSLASSTQGSSILSRVSQSSSSTKPPSQTGDSGLLMLVSTKQDNTTDKPVNDPPSSVDSRETVKDASKTGTDHSAAGPLLPHEHQPSRPAQDSASSISSKTSMESLNADKPSNQPAHPTAKPGPSNLQQQLERHSEQQQLNQPLQSQSDHISNDEEDEDEDWDEDDEEEHEPLLRYHRLPIFKPTPQQLEKQQQSGATSAATNKRLIERGTLSATYSHEKFLLCGTTSGLVIQYDLSGNEIMRVQCHSTAITCLSSDAPGDFIGSSSADGSVVITDLYSKEQWRIQYSSRVLSIALCPQFKHQQHSVAVGTQNGQLSIANRGWLGYRDNIIHENEGPVHAMVWNVDSGLLAWSTNKGVKVLDVAQAERIAFVTRPTTTIGEEVDATPHLVWARSDVLIIAWHDTVKVCQVKYRNMEEVEGHISRVKGGKTTPAVSKGPRGNRFMQVIALVTIDDGVIAGVAPVNEYLALLVYHYRMKSVEQLEIEKQLAIQQQQQTTTSGNKAGRQPAILPYVVNPPEMKLVSYAGETVSSDALALFNYSSSKYHDISLVAMTGSDPLLYISNGKDMILAALTGVDDKLLWFYSRGRYTDGVELCISYAHQLSAAKQQWVIEIYLWSLLLAKDYSTCARELLRFLPDDHTPILELWVQIFHLMGAIHVLAPILIEFPIASDANDLNCIGNGSYKFQMTSSNGSSPSPSQSITLKEVIQHYITLCQSIPHLSSLPNQAKQKGVNIEPEVINDNVFSYDTATSSEFHQKKTITSLTQLPVMPLAWKKQHMILSSQNIYLATSAKQMRTPLHPHVVTDLMTGLLSGEHYSLAQMWVERLTLQQYNANAVVQLIISILTTPSESSKNQLANTSGVSMLSLEQQQLSINRRILVQSNLQASFERFTATTTQIPLERVQNAYEAREPTIQMLSLHVQPQTQGGNTASHHLANEPKRYQLVLYQILIHIYNMQNRYTDALCLCLHVFHPSIFTILEQRRLFWDVRENLLELALFHPYQAIHLYTSTYKQYLDYVKQQTDLNPQFFVEAHPSSSSTAHMSALTGSAPNTAPSAGGSNNFTPPSTPTSTAVPVSTSTLLNKMISPNITSGSAPNSPTTSVTANPPMYFPPSLVVEKLQMHPYLLYVYFESLYKIDANALNPFIPKVLTVFAKFASDDIIIHLLRTNTNYKLEHAVAVCDEWKRYSPLVFLFHRMGNFRMAVDLLLRKLRNVQRAVKVVLDAQDPSLWDVIFENCANDPQLLTDLLDYASAHATVDVVALLKKIPETAEIPNLKELLMTILRNTRIHLGLTQIACHIAQRDNAIMLRRLLAHRLSATVLLSPDIKENPITHPYSRTLSDMANDRRGLMLQTSRPPVSHTPVTSRSRHSFGLLRLFGTPQYIQVVEDDRETNLQRHAAAHPNGEVKSTEDDIQNIIRQHTAGRLNVTDDLSELSSLSSEMSTPLTLRYKRHFDSILHDDGSVSSSETTVASSTTPAHGHAKSHCIKCNTCVMLNGLPTHDKDSSLLSQSGDTYVGALSSHSQGILLFGCGHTVHARCLPQQVDIYNRHAMACPLCLGIDEFIHSRRQGAYLK